MRCWMNWLVVAAAVALIGGCASPKLPQILAAKAVPDQIQAGDSCSLIVSTNGIASDKFRIHWQAAKGAKVASPGDSMTTLYAPEKPGAFKVTVTVTNAAGKIATQTVSVTVGQATSVYSGSLGDDQGIGTGRPPKTPRVRPSRRNPGQGGQTPSRRANPTGGTQ